MIGDLAYVTAGKDCKPLRLSPLFAPSRRVLAPAMMLAEILRMVWICANRRVTVLYV
jgi:hypothetical protein